MNGLIKRMCILKQLKGGFSADGNALSGVVRIEKYGKLSSLQLSLINFAPLSDGRYVCVLCDKQGERLIFTLLSGRGEYSAENSPFDPEKGFCALICFVKNNEVQCIAAGQYGSGGYNVKLLTEGLTMPENTVKKQEPAPMPQPKKTPEREIVFLKGERYGEPYGEQYGGYDDEAVSTSNYYAKECAHECGDLPQDFKDEDALSTDTQKEEPNGADVAQDEEAAPLLHPFKPTDGQAYYNQIREELEDLFERFERADDLKRALPESEWVRVDDAGGCLVGVVYENLEVKYIAYALPANGKTPPEEISDACFVPVQPLSEESEGYFVLFQDAATGEVVKISQG